MPNAVRRVGGTASYRQTYTLGPQERFRLDSVSFSIPFAYDGQVLNPTLRVNSASGQTIAEITGTQEDILGPPGFSQFFYTGPAAFTDDDQMQPPRGYYGYGIHDFGAGLTTSQITINNAHGVPPVVTEAFTWLRSPGAVTMGPAIGAAQAALTDTLTVQLSAPIAAGDYLLISMVYLDQVQKDSSDFEPRPTVTDPVGGNVLDFSGHNSWAFAYEQLAITGGMWIHGGSEFYRIVNPLAAGDLVTVKLNNTDPLWFGMHVHDVAGLTVGNPIGPNAGGNYVGFNMVQSTNPFTTASVPTPIWTGAVLFAGIYQVGTPNTLDVCMARGQTYFAVPLHGIFGPGPDFTQIALPELDLEPRDTITALALDQDGTPRVGDLITDFLIYGVDE
jgi:hypothetical protein